MASSARCLSLGPEHYKKRLQDSVPHPPHFQGVVAMKAHQEFRGVSGTASRCCARSYEASGTHECTKTENHFSGDRVGLDHDAGTSVSCMCRFDPNHCKRHQTRPGAFSFKNSKAVRSHGSLFQMRPFPFWLKSRGFHHLNHPSSYMFHEPRAMCSLTFKDTSIPQ